MMSEGWWLSLKHDRYWSDDDGVLLGNRECLVELEQKNLEFG